MINLSRELTSMRFINPTGGETIRADSARDLDIVGQLKGGTALAAE